MRDRAPGASETPPRGWRLPGHFGDVLIARRIDVPPESLAAREALGHDDVEMWLADPWARATVLEIYATIAGLAPRHGYSVAPGAMDAAIRGAIERSLHEGSLVMLRTREPAWVRLGASAAIPVAKGDVPPPGVEDDWIFVALFDSAGKPVKDAIFEVRQGSEKLGGGMTDTNGVGRVLGIPPRGTSSCTVSFEGWANTGCPLALDAPASGPPKPPSTSVRAPLDGPHLRRRCDLARPQDAHLSTTTMYQLVRRVAQVLELEHFTSTGAVLLPGFSPAKLRAGAPCVTGIDALRAAFEYVKGQARILVTGHHAVLSNERAQGVQLLLMGKRAEWAALSAKVATHEDKDELRQWSAQALAVDDSAWTATTWEAIFDEYMAEVALARDEPQSHKLRILPPDQMPENIYPVKMAEICFGAAQAARAQELEPLNPGLCRGPWNWRNIVPGDAIVMPKEWPIQPLVDRGFTVVPLHEVPSSPTFLPIEGAPRATGCGDHHRVLPDMSEPTRRAEERHVEILILPGEHVVCSHETQCDTSSCEVYDPMAFDHAYRAIEDSADGTLVVYVVDTEQRRLASATVIVEGRRSVRAVSDGEGIARFSHLTPGNYRIHASKNGYNTGESVVVVGQSKAKVVAPSTPGQTSGSPPSSTNVQLTSQSRIRVTAVDFRRPQCTRGYPVDNLTLWNVNGTAPSTRLGVTDDDGTLVLSPARYNLEAWMPGFEQIEGDAGVVDLGAGKLVELRMMLKERASNLLRQLIKDLAEREAKIWDNGKKQNNPNEASWERLNQYYQALHVGADWFTNTRKGRRIAYPEKPNEWCGIFAVWVVRMAARPCAYWKDGAGPQELGPPISTGITANALRIGDVVRFKSEKDEPWRKRYSVLLAQYDKEGRKDAAKEAGIQTNRELGAPPNHHGLVTAIDSSASVVDTVEGNTTEPSGVTGDAAAPFACALRSFKGRHNVSDIAYFYRSVPD